MAANFATIPQCHFCYTHTLATLPAFGHLGEPRRPLFGNVASLWQPCHCLEHFGGSVLAATVTPPRRRDQNQPVPPALPALGLPPTTNCPLPSAHCPLPLRRSAQDRAKRTPPAPPSQGGKEGVAAARVRKLFQNGDWPICLVGPVPVLKQLLSDGRNWQRAYRGRSC